LNSWLHATLESLQQTAIATAIRENELLFPWVESAHVLAICIVVGTISIVDLRLLGIALRDRPVLPLSRGILFWTWIAFALAAVTGALLFSAKALAYAGNFFFRTKLIFLMLAGLNMAGFHRLFDGQIAKWDARMKLPLGARVAGGLSLLIWAGVVGFGRWIGFTLH
jgi:uncharacterized protein DUF6644